MILITCLSCLNAVRVSSLQVGEIEGLFFTLHEWPNNLTCPTCGGPAKGYKSEEISEAALAALRVRDLSPVEAHAALLGAGFPEECICQGSVVSELLREVPVRRVIGKDIPNTGRFCIDRLELWDGTLVYFGSSNQGAIVYRIARRNKEVSHGG